jgi:hypothetical protein
MRDNVRTDLVNHPSHYCSHPSGVECLDITEHMPFNLGNAFKYIWRADLKGRATEDLQKARFYLDREIALRTKFEATQLDLPFLAAPTTITDKPQKSGNRSVICRSAGAEAVAKNPGHGTG